MDPGVDEVGVNYFLHSFIAGTRPSSRGCLNYVPSVFRADGAQSTLVSSMAAVGLVALANSTQQAELASQARCKYSEAIAKVNAALESPTESTKDSTLMSVITLGVFEHVSRHESWQRHVQGAAALVVARGVSQFTKPVGVHMFNQVRADVLIACFQSRGVQWFPEDMLKLQDEAARHVDTSSLFWLLGVLGTRCANLLSKVRAHSGEYIRSGFLEEATILERDFLNASKTLAVEEPYSITRDLDGDTELVYHGRIDICKDFWAIRLWNNCRTLRIILGEILLFLLNKALAADIAPTLRDHLKLRVEGTFKALVELGDDVLATVPQSMDFVSAADTQIQQSVQGGYLLIWGLYMVGQCVVTKSETRRWVMRRLEDIGRTAGMSVTAQLVQDIKKIDDWAADNL